MILVDPPVWPAYGTTWSHLVSDVSLEELHDFATQLGLPERGFDHDHYDVPAVRYDEVIAAGARPVAAREVLAALQRSGLRVAPRDRARVGRERRRADLTRRWARLPAQLRLELDPESAAGGWAATTGGWATTGGELLDRWGESHRLYHDAAHLLDVLLTLDLLAQEGHGGGGSAVLAGWFHDAVYDGVPGRDEQASADLAVRTLTGLGVTSALVARVGDLIAGTATPGWIDGPDAAALNDADLAVLAGSPQRYNRYAAAVRREYAHVPDEAFQAGRVGVLERLLTLPTLYHTPPARRRWERRARENLTRELDQLTGAG